MASKKRGERERRKRKKKTQGGKNQVCDPEAEGRVRGGMERRWQTYKPPVVG